MKKFLLLCLLFYAFIIIEPSQAAFCKGNFCYSYNNNYLPYYPESSGFSFSYSLSDNSQVTYNEGIYYMSRYTYKISPKYYHVYGINHIKHKHKKPYYSKKYQHKK